MQIDNQISTKAEALRGLMQKHLGIKAKSLDQAVRRAGRQLPRGLRAQAAELVAAQKLAEHPKLARRIDHKAVDAAFRNLSVYLTGIDLAEQRKTRALNLLALLVLNLLLVGVALGVFMRWRGLI